MWITKILKTSARRSLADGKAYEIRLFWNMSKTVFDRGEDRRWVIHK